MRNVVEGLLAEGGATPDVFFNDQHLLRHASRSHRDSEIVTKFESGEHQYTYGEMYARVQKAANALEELGVEPGDAVGIYGYSTHRFIELIYALGGMGATPFAINVELPPADKQYCIEHVSKYGSMDVIFADEELLPSLEPAIDDPDAFDYFVLEPDDDAEHGFDPVESYETLLEDASPEYDWPTVNEQTIAYLQFTGGTTGRPKPVALSHRIVYHNALAISATTGMSNQDTVFMIPPLFHLGFLFWAIAPTVGANLVLPGTGYPDNLLEVMLAEDITFTTAVPTFFNRLLEDIEKREDDVDLDGVQILIGGQAPTTDLIERLEALGGEVAQAYGSAESGGPQFAMNVQNELRDREREMTDEELLRYKSQTSGYLQVGVDVKLRDEDGTEVPQDGESAGELCIRSPGAIEGYWKMPEKTVESDYDGYLRTGDWATVDEHGNVELLDRIKDAVKSGGEWIPSQRLENLINEHPLVNEACVIAADHPEWGERPIAALRLTDGETSDAEDIDIEAHLMSYVERGTIEKWWIPEEWIILDDIPQTSVGKHDKKSLRDEYGDVLVE